MMGKKMEAAKSEAWLEGYRIGMEDRDQSRDRNRRQSGIYGYVVYEVRRIAQDTKLDDRRKWLEMEHLANRAIEEADD
jgi:hypothetical protein